MRTPAFAPNQISYVDAEPVKDQKVGDLCVQINVVNEETTS